MLKSPFLVGAVLLASVGLASAELIGFYPFDDAANPLADASSSANDLTPGGTSPVYESAGGFSGGAYHFNASGRLVVPININPSEKPQLTLGAWVKTDTIDPGLRKIMGSDDGGWDRTIGLDNREPDFAFRYTSFTGDGPPVEGTPGPESVDEWSFVAAVYDQGTSEVTVYVDLDASTTDDELGFGVTEPTGFGDGTTSLSIGSISPSNNNEGWLGLIDNAFVFDEALDAAAVERLRDGGPAALYALTEAALPSENLVAFYSFDDGAAPRKDDSGNGNNLASASPTPVDPTHAAAGGVAGGGLNFDGTQRFIVPVNVNPDVMPKMTMGAWVKTSSLDPGLRKVLGSDDGGWDRTIGLDTREPDFTFRYTAFVGSGPPVAGTPGPESIDDWTFLAASHDQAAGTVTVFVDLDASTTDDLPVAVAGSASFGNGPGSLALGGVGPNGAGEAWLGSMDNVFIYDTTLSLSQILTLRNEGKVAILATDNPNLVAPLATPFGALGQVTGEITRTFEVRNDGSSEDLEISSAEITGKNASAYSVTVFPSTLDSGMAGNVVIAFQPDNAIGQFEATLVLTSNDQSNSRTEIDLSATVTRGLSGLIGLYLFDNPSKPLLDETLGGKDLVTPGGAADPTFNTVGGVTGGAYSFAGAQRLIAPLNINPSTVPELTMGAWVKTSTLDPGLRKVIGTDDGGWDRTIGLDTREPDLTFRYTSFTGDGPPVAATPGPTSTADWTFFAATFSQTTNAVTVFVDLNSATTADALVAFSEPTGFGSGTSTTAIGGINPSNANEAWQGQIDNVFFFNRVLDSDELTEIRNGGSAALLPVPTIPTDKLLGYYSFDDPNNPTRDLSGNNNDLDATLAEPTYTETGGFNAGAYEFNGNQRLVAPIDINPSEHPQLTMGAWVKTSSLTPGLRKVMGGDDGGWDRTIGLDNREPDFTFRYTSFTGDGPPVTGTSGPESVDDWTFLAAVYDEDLSEVTVYVDLDARSIGDQVVSVTEPAVFGSGLPELSIGSLRADNNNEGWVGRIDNAFIFAEALSQEQITLLRDLGSAFPPPEEDPDLKVTLPALGALSRDPAVQTFSVSVSNGGISEVLTISGATIVGPDADRFAVTAVPASLAPQTSGAVSFTFDSKGQVGTFDAVMEINSTDPSQPSQRFSLNVTVVPPAPLDPILTVVTSNPFAGLGINPGPVRRQVTIRNTGATLPLTIASATISGAAAAKYAIVSSPAAPIAPGASGVFEISFDSSGAAGTFTASLDLVSTNASNRKTAIDITAIVPLDPGNLAQALIGYWSFDDADNPLADDSGKGNTLEMDGADPQYVADTGFADSGAFEFFGAEHLIAPIDINPAAEPVLTIGAWVKATNIDPGLRKVMGSDDGGWDRTIGLDSREPDFTFRYTSFTGDGPPVTGTPSPASVDDWTFFAASYDESAGTVTVFVDLDSTTTDDAVVAVTEPALFNPGLPTLSIGSLRPDTTAEAWVGLIDNPFVYRAALSIGDITAIRDAGNPSGGTGGTGGRLGFRITSFSIGADRSVTINWDGARSNAAFILEASSNLIQWEEVADGIEEKTITVPSPAGLNEIYYRVTLEP